MIVCAKHVSNWTECKRVVFQNILSFAEELSEDAFDDNLIDSIYGISLLSNGAYCISTEKREIILRVESVPFSEDAETRSPLKPR